MSARTATPANDRYAALTEDILDAVRQAGAGDEFILKSRVAAFEAAVVEATGFAYAIACAGVQGGVSLALHALGIGRGHEVVVPAFGDLGAVSAVALTGAVPVFADVDPERGTLAPGHAAAVTAHTRAVLASPGDTALHEAVRRDGLPLIEVQHGWRPGADHPASPPPNSVRVVSMGPEGVLGGIGDGAVLLTDDAETATALRMLRNHGQDLRIRFYHPRVGFNCRMDESVAAFLVRRIATTDMPAVAALAERFRAGMSAAPGLVPVPGGHLAFGGFPIRLHRRDGARRRLADLGLAVAPSRVLLLPAHPVFAGAGVRGRYPAAERFGRELLILPMHPQLADETVDAMVTALVRVMREPA